MAMCRRALGDQPRVQTSLVTPCENPQFLSWAICDEIGVSVQAVDDERLVYKSANGKKENWG